VAALPRGSRLVETGEPLTDVREEAAGPRTGARSPVGAQSRPP